MAAQEVDAAMKLRQLQEWNSKILSEHELLILAIKQRRFDAIIQGTRNATGKRRTPAEVEADRELWESIERAKARMLDILSEDWVLQALILLIIGGSAAFAAQHVFVQTTTSATSFVHEVSQLAHTLRSLTELIRVAASQVGKWVAGSMGAAVGDTAGPWLAALFPQVPGSAAFASAAARAAGAYAGYTFMSQ